MVPVANDAVMCARDTAPNGHTIHADAQCGKGTHHSPSLLQSTPNDESPHALILREPPSILQSGVKNLQETNTRRASYQIVITRSRHAGGTPIIYIYTHTHTQKERAGAEREKGSQRESQRVESNRERERACERERERERERENKKRERDERTRERANTLTYLALLALSVPAPHSAIWAANWSR